MSSPILDRPERLQAMDPAGMSDLLRNFPHQIRDGIQIGESFKLPSSFKGPIEKIVFIGMGGSAIGGDVIRSLAASDGPVPISVSRHYKLPPFVDAKTLCVFSSYSGNTEETLSAFREGRGKRLKAIVITSGGELAQKAKENAIPWIEIPKGFPPRAAVGYSVFPLLKVLGKLKVVKWDAQGVEETLSVLESLERKKWDPDVPSRSNPAKQLAQALWGRWTVIYAGTELLDSAALRFRNQIEENAKAMASHHLIPEMNHNEILGWQFPEQVLSKTTCVFLKDAEDHARIKLRIQITKDLLIKKHSVPVQEIESEGKSRLTRLFSVISLGDWVSFYLALLYRIDPTPVVVIEFLKKELAKTK